MGFFFGRKSKQIPPNTTFRLTQQGEAKLQEFTGDAKQQVLVALQTRGTSDIDEISKESGINRGQVEKLILVLMRGGYIQPVSAASIAEGMD